ncbi:hypothetical protein OROMI_007426 [Orobanche minor]
MPSYATEGAHSTGVFVHEDLILTSYHNIVGFDRVEVHLYDVFGFLPVDVGKKKAHDLALLRLREGHKCDHVRLASNESVTNGMQIFSITNSFALYSFFHMGHVTYPCLKNDLPPNTDSLDNVRGCRIMKDLYDKKEDLGEFMKDVSGDLKVIQMYNINGSRGASGSPIFDGRGLLVGIYMCIMGNMEIAVHVSHICEFIGGMRHLFDTSDRVAKGNKGKYIEGKKGKYIGGPKRERDEDRQKNQGPPTKGGSIPRNYKVAQSPTDSISSLACSPKTNLLVATSSDNQHFGMEIIAKELQLDEGHPDVHRLFLAVYKSFMEANDAIDKGINRYETDQPPIYVNNTHSSSRVGRFNLDCIEPDQSPEKEKEAFHRTMALAGGEFLDSVRFHVKSWLPARSIVMECVSARQKYDPSGEIMVLDRFCPWKLHLFELEQEMNIEPLIKYVLYQIRRQEQRLESAPDSFESRKPLPSQWRGLRDDELSKESGIPGGVFVHMSGFIGGNQTYEGALAMAKAPLKVLYWKEK